MNELSNAAVPDWNGLRALMPVTAKWAYFDNAAVAPLPSPTQQVIEKWLTQATAEGDTVWPEWARGIEQTRALAAAMINAEPAEIALVPNTTTGIGLVAEGFPWQSGDNVVTLANEFPSNAYPWMNLASRGVETRRVPVDNGVVDPNRVAEACDERTRLIAVSWVGYASGWRIDVAQMAALAHDHGAYFFLDAIQGMGVFPLDVRDAQVDFLAADGHKWMLGPEGAGILFVRRSHLDMLRPLGIGWNSVVNSADFSHVELRLRDEAARYEGGSQNMAGMLALGASLRLLTEHGVAPRTSAVGDRVLEITEYACRRLEEIGARVASHRREGHASGIVSFEVPGRDPMQARNQCLAAGVALSCRGGRLRISPHAYANEDDIERMIAILA
jgi:selenocysteine lyase/cysteine desulfurase